MASKEEADAEGPRTLPDSTVSPRAVTSRTVSAEFAETEPDLFTSVVCLVTAAKPSSAGPSRAKPTRISSVLNSRQVNISHFILRCKKKLINFAPRVFLGWNKFCVITVASRKSCQKCRFEACVQIGMEISWVMSEAERQRLLVTRMAKKRKIDYEPAECSTPSSSTSEPSPPVLLHKSRPLQDYLWPLYPDNVN